MNRQFTARPLLYALALPVFIVLCGLGVWQLQRLSWKLSLIEGHRALQNAAPIQTDLSHPLFGLEDFYPVEVTGTLDLSKAIGFFGRSVNGRQGQDFYAPLTFNDAQVLWVKLGLAPDYETTDAPTAFGALPKGQIYQGGWRGNPSFNPGNDPERGLWAVADPVEMSTHVGLDSEATLPMLVELTESLGERSPFTPNPTLDFLRNPHLSYAVQWFSFAAILLIFVLILSFPKRGKPE